MKKAGRPRVIQESELPTLIQLCEALKTKVVAEKWGITTVTLRKTFKHFNLPTPEEIHMSYRYQYYKEQKSLGFCNKAIAIDLDISYDALARTISKFEKGCRKHIYDEYGLCFECDKKQPH